MRTCLSHTLLAFLSKCLWGVRGENRRLLVDPDKHHALHLSAVREASASTPTKLLKRYLKSSMALVMPEQVLRMVASRRGETNPSPPAFNDLADVEEVEVEPESEEPVHGKAGKFLA